MSGYGDMLAWQAGEVDYDRDADREEPTLDEALAPLADAIADAAYWLRRDGLRGAAASLYDAVCAGDVVTRVLPLMERDGLRAATDGALAALFAAAMRMEVCS